MPQVLDHVHIYVRYRKSQSGEVYYKCADPDCYTVVPAKLILGKRSRCAICHTEEFVINWRHLRLVRPRCDNCSQSGEAKAKRRLIEIVGKVLEESEVKP